MSQPSVIQDESLALWLDAAQSESYSGTGATWFDLSGNDNHAILGGNTSAVAFNPDGYFEHRPNPETWTNGGFWHIPHSPSLNPNGGFWTVCGSFTHPLPQSHNGGGWFGKRQLGINIETINWGGHRVRTNIGAYTTTWDTALPFSDDFVYFCVSFEQSTGMYGSNPGSLRTYLNDNLVSAVSATPQVDMGDPIRLARRIGHLQHYMYADIANYQYYTRTLSDDEIGQLYSAHRSLFDSR